MSDTYHVILALCLLFLFTGCGIDLFESDKNYLPEYRTEGVSEGNFSLRSSFGKLGIPPYGNGKSLGINVYDGQSNIVSSDNVNATINGVNIPNPGINDLTYSSQMTYELRLSGPFGEASANVKAPSIDRIYLESIKDTISVAEPFTVRWNYGTSSLNDGTILVSLGGFDSGLLEPDTKEYTFQANSLSNYLGDNHIEIFSIRFAVFPDLKTPPGSSSFQPYKVLEENGSYFTVYVGVQGEIHIKE